METMAQLLEDIEESRKKHRARQAGKQPQLRVVAEPASAPVPAQAAPEQLPLWSDAVRGVPNAILRSALFGVVRHGKKREYLERELKASVNGISIRYTGMQLDQSSDLDVWEQCLHIARTERVGEVVRFKLKAFLKSIGRGTGGTDRKWLISTLSRLQATSVEIQSGGLAYSGSLLPHLWENKNTGEYCLQLNEKILCLFGAGAWTGIERDERKSLAGKSLAQWLHGFYSSHAEPYPYKVETLWGLSGSTVSHLRNFRVKLKVALAALEQATGWQCHIDEKSDLVYVKKPKHLHLV